MNRCRVVTTKTELQCKILITAYDNPELTNAEIARRLDCSDSYVSQVLNRYSGHDAMEARIEELDAQLDMGASGGGWGIGEPTTAGGGNFNDPISADLGDIEDGLEDIGPVGALLVAVIVGGFLLVANPLSGSMPLVRFGMVGICIIVIAAIVIKFYQTYHSEGLSAATSWLLGPTESTGTASKSSNEAVEKTPPAPKSLKDDLKFDRADLECEWCGEDIDQLEVHHITPRSEGGPNKPSNLAVLCPNCHRKADRGAISRSDLRSKIRRQTK